MPALSDENDYHGFVEDTVLSNPYSADMDSGGALSGTQATMMKLAQEMIPERPEVLQKRKLLDMAMQRLTQAQQSTADSLPRVAAIENSRNPYQALTTAIFKGGQDRAMAAERPAMNEVERAKIGTEFDNQDIGNVSKLMAYSGARGNAWDIRRDGRGNIIRTNKLTGESTIVRPDGTSQSMAKGPDGLPIEPPQKFTLENLDPTSRKQREAADLAVKKAHDANRPAIENALQLLDVLEPNFDNVKTGSAAAMPAAEVKGLVDFIYPGDTPEYNKEYTAAMNIEKGTNDLVNELQKLQRVPGTVNSVLGLKTLLASKPGMRQPDATNRNIVAGLRTKLHSALLSNEIFDRYRDMNSLGVSDANTAKIEQAIKDKYPIESVDPQTGVVTFNRANYEKAMAAVPSEIESYIASLNSGGGAAAGAVSAPASEGDAGASATKQDSGNLPEGAVRVGTHKKTGKPVFRLPDGSMVMEQ